VAEARDPAPSLYPSRYPSCAVPIPSDWHRSTLAVPWKHAGGTCVRGTCALGYHSGTTKSSTASELEAIEVWR